MQGEEEQSDGHRFDEKRQEVKRAQKIMEIRHEFSEAENEGHFESGQTQRCQKIAEQNNSHSSAPRDILLLGIAIPLIAPGHFIMSQEIR